MNHVLLRLEENRNKYTDTEKRILEFICDNPVYVIENSIVKIARECSVSDATITRFSRKAGFKGFNELKQLLSQEEFKAKFKGKYDAENGIFQNLVSDYKELLDKTAGYIDIDKINELIDIINNSNRIKVYGISSSGLFAHEMSYKLSRIGYDIRAITDSHEMRRDAATSALNDLVIGVSLSGVTIDVVEALEIARNNKSKVAAFTYYPDSKIAECSDITVTVPQKDLMESGQFINSQISLLFMLDYIYAEIMSKDLEKYLSIRTKIIHSIANKDSK